MLECARASGEFVSARKGMADIRLRIYGRAAHAGVEPEKGRSAIVAGAELVREIHALNGRWPTVTANVGVFKAGTRPNIVLRRGRAPGRRPGDVRRAAGGGVAAIAELAASPAVPDVTVDIETMHGWAPMEKLERSGRLAEHVISLARRLGFETKDVATGGASDANTTSGMGVPDDRRARARSAGMDHSPGGVPRGRLDRAPDDAPRGAAARGRARPGGRLVADPPGATDAVTAATPR